MQRTQAGKLVPAEPALLAEAARWVDSWQEPTGHTNYDAALQMAERYMEADCAYIFSDGLSDYAVVLLEVNFKAHPLLTLSRVQFLTAETVNLENHPGALVDSLVPRCTCM